MVKHHDYCNDLRVNVWKPFGEGNPGDHEYWILVNGSMPVIFFPAKRYGDFRHSSNCN
jgi:hypothetical protein